MLRQTLRPAQGVRIALLSTGFGFLTIATSFSIRLLGGTLMLAGMLPSILAAAAAERERDRLDTLQWSQRQLGREQGVEQMDATDERRAPQERRGARS
jgi:hypothetical protein